MHLVHARGSFSNPTSPEDDPMKVPPARIVFNEEDRKKILARVEESLSTGQLTLGKNGKEFEQKPKVS